MAIPIFIHGDVAALKAILHSFQANVAQAIFVRTSGQDGQLQGVEGRAQVPVGRSSDKV